MKLVDNYKYLVETKKSRRYECATNKHCLCLSTADSDFRFPQYITEDVAKYMEHGDLNYSFRKEEFRDTINYWYKKEYGNEKTQDFKTTNIIIGNGVINFLQLAIRSFSNEGDGIIFFSPVYYSFQTAILNLDRKVQKSKLIFNPNTKEFEINFEEFEKLMKKESNKILLFCSPHNPIGKVWSFEDIQKIIKIARKHNVYIVSDEIWQDIIFENHEVKPLVYLCEKSDKVISTASFAKTFNLGGAQFGFALSYNEDIIETMRKRKETHLLYASDNLLNIEIFKSCVYNEENYKWLQEYKIYIHKNYLLLKKAIKDTKIVMPNMNGTYLCWLDFSKYENITTEKIDEIFESNYIFLENGDDFCEPYKLARRINISISSKHLIKCISVIKENFSN